MYVLGDAKVTKIFQSVTQKITISTHPIPLNLSNEIKNRI